MVGFIGLIWILQVANWADHYQLDFSYGILPRNIGRLPEIFTAPFLHFSWDHIEGNSGPLFVFGLLAAYRGVGKFLGVTLLVAITSGLAVWLFQGNNQLTVGASGLIFGYFGYVLSRGLIDRNLIDALAAVVMGLSYAYILTVAIPGTPGVSWIGHLGGLVGGIAAGWIFRTRRPSEAKLPGDSGNSGGRPAGTHRGHADEPGPSARGFVQGTGRPGSVERPGDSRWSCRARTDPIERGERVGRGAERDFEHALPASGVHQVGAHDREIPWARRHDGDTLTFRAQRLRLADKQVGEQLPEPPLDPQVRLERMVGFGAGHRSEDVDLVHVRAAQGAE